MSTYKRQGHELTSVSITDSEVHISKADLDKLPTWMGKAPDDANAGDLFARREADGWATGVVKLRGSSPHIGANYELVCADRGEKPKEKAPATKSKTTKKKSSKK